MLHIGVIEGCLRVGDTVKLSIDEVSKSSPSNPPNIFVLKMLSAY